MHDAAAGQRRLGQRILEKGGDLPLALVLEVIVPVRRLRTLVRERGLTPKGGFRVDKAPAHVLAPLLAEQRDPECVDAIVKLLVPMPAAAEPAAAPASPAVPDATDGAPDNSEAAAPPGDGASPPAAGPQAVGPSSPGLPEHRALLALRDAELVRQRDELERARESAARGRDREADWQRRVQQLEQRLLAVQREQRSPMPPVGPEPTRDDKELQRRVHQLEGEREDVLAADAELRRNLALNQTRIRELEAEVQELEALLPKGKRRRKAPAPEPPPDDRRFRLPRFTAAFYKSLEGKERRGVERAIQAVLLFCTEGHSYPGLEVKQLGGQDTWSLRASLGLRVYFKSLPDGDIELLELGDREDQNTTLRRLKDR
jgi:hypothetical protein